MHLKQTDIDESSKQSLIATYIRYCERAANEAIAAAGKGAPRGARAAARLAVLGTLPTLDTPEKTQAYIACVAWAASKMYLSPKDASRMLYAAQVAMTNRERCIPSRI